MKNWNLIFPMLCLTLLALGAGSASGREQQGSPTPPAIFNFANDAVGQPPVGFTSYASGDGPAGKWLVQKLADAPGGSQVVVQTEANDTDNRYPVLMAEGPAYGDVDLSVKAKALSGRVDQAMGLVFRFGDPRSYYVVRANALENNFRLYKMVQGRRIQFAGAEVQVAPNRWHTLRVVAQGDHIVCSFDGRKLIDVHDATYAGGQVGLWTKADSVTAFADLTVSQP